MQNGVQSERQLQVAYLGPTASFSHQATIQAFATYPQGKLHPLLSFDAVLAGVQKSSRSSKQDDSADADFDFAVLPVENSTNGSVVPALDLLTHCDRDSDPCLFPDIEVVGEQYLEVHHCLFVHPFAVGETISESVSDGPRDHAIALERTPLHQKLNIKTLYTHPQVWGQCDRFLSFHFPPSKVERRNVNSTSAAAAFVAQHSTTPTNTNTEQDPSPTPRASQEGIIAAISSSLAGAQNHLVCLAANIEDEPGRNTTRFLIIRNKHHPPLSPETIQQLPWLAPSPTQNTFYKSLITFTNMHDSTPGALASALAVFQKHNFNLTSITTRPSRERPWHYVFFVECEEERSPGQDDGGIRSLFSELSRVTQRTTLLGSWINRLKHTSI